MTSQDELKESTLDLSADAIDSTLNLLTESELLEDVPVAGSIYKLSKALSSIPNAIFLHKVGRFLEKVNDKTTQEQRIKFAQKIRESKKYRDNLYGSIFLRIDKFDEIKKSDLFGKIFACFITNKIRESDFKTLSSTLNLTSTEELKEFSSTFFRLNPSRLSSEAPETYKRLSQTRLIASFLDNEKSTSGMYIKDDIARAFQQLAANLDKITKFKVTNMGAVFAYIIEDFEDYFLLVRNDSMLVEIRRKKLEIFDKQDVLIEFPEHFEMKVGEYAFGRNYNLQKKIHEKFP